MYVHLYTYVHMCIHCVWLVGVNTGFQKLQVLVRLFIAGTTTCAYLFISACVCIVNKYWSVQHMNIQQSFYTQTKDMWYRLQLLKARLPMTSPKLQTLSAKPYTLNSCRSAKISSSVRKPKPKSASHGIATSWELSLSFWAVAGKVETVGFH